MFQDVFILGATGRVGKTLVDQIYEFDVNSNIHKNPTRIIGLASSKLKLYNPDGISPSEAKSFLNRESGESNDSVLNITNSLDYDTKKSNIVFVDATNSDSGDIFKFHSDIIRNTSFGLVTANKNPLVDSHFEPFNRLISDVNRYGYRCCVMAGAEVVDKVRDLRDLGDTPKRIEGCLSGTLGYICTELHNGVPFSDAVKEAVKLGYAESDPSIDLSGTDVLKKIFILARSAGFDVTDNNITLESFVQLPGFLNGKMENLSSLDKIYAQKVKNAVSNGNVLRYIASFDSENKSINIGLREVSKDSVFGLLKGRANKVKIISSVYNDDTPYISPEVPGAGLDITAQNIRTDLLHQLKERKLISV